MKPVKSGFSLVEILLTIAILIVLSVIAVTGYSFIKEKSFNANVAKSVQSLDTGLTMYQEDKKLFPLPDGNLKYFSSGGIYVHPGFDQDIFGVSGFITQKTLNAQYLPKFSLDPRSNQYYAYGITDNQKYFQVAGIVKHNDEPFTLVTGNYSDLKSTELTNIVKEYAGPEFVYNDSNAYFPYNPEERMLIARIVSYSGSLTINGTPADAPTVQATKLMEGDRVTISTGGLANIYYSDGSNSELGSTGSYTDFTFASMRYQNQDNLLTQIRIALNFGKIFTRVVKLASSSEFEIYTKDAIASVRGTVFTVIYDGHTTWIVDQGKVEVREDSTAFSDLPPLIESIKSKGIETGIPVVVPVDPVFAEDTKTYIEVKPGQKSKSYTLIKGGTPPTPIAGTCGSAHNNPTSVAPTTNLCTVGTSTVVTGTGPWNWTCIGIDGGDDTDCSANDALVLVNGVCGSANGGCSAGSLSWKTNTSSCGTTATWNCNGANGGTNATNCSYYNGACAVKGVCGSAKDYPRVNNPTTNLCADGSTPTISTTSCGCYYKWTCNGINGGASAECSIQVIKKPKSTSATVAQNTITWKWTYDTTGGTPTKYQGSADNGITWIELGTGTVFVENNLNCNTPYSRLVRACDITNDCTTGTTLTATPQACSVTPSCGTSSGSYVDIQSQLTALCNRGTASTIDPDGNTFKWTCTGSPWTNDAQCMAYKKINGVCGSDNGGTLQSKPTTNRCSSGNPGEVTETLKNYTWMCNGINSTINLSCSANRIVTGNGCDACPGPIGSTDKVQNDGVPKGPFNDSCHGSDNYRNANYCKYVVKKNAGGQNERVQCSLERELCDGGVIHANPNSWSGTYTGE